MYGGSFLGTQKQLPNETTLPKIAASLAKYNIHALLVIGGFEVCFLTFIPFILLSARFPVAQDISSSRRVWFAIVEEPHRVWLTPRILNFIF